MQYLNAVYASILLACAAFLYLSPMYSYAVKTRFAFFTTVALMLHFVIITNAKMFRNLNIKYDTSFYEDLRQDSYADLNLRITPELEYFKTCVDASGRQLFLPTMLVKDKVLLLKHSPVVRLEEIVSNILIDNFGHSKISVIDMKEPISLPKTSIFNLKKFKPLILKYRIIDRLASKTVIIFKHVDNEETLGNLMRIIHELGSGKLIVVFLVSTASNAPMIHEDVIDCEEYELDEFKMYLKRKKINFADFSNEDLLQITGSDIKLIERILEKPISVFTKSDIVELVDQFKAETQIKALNSCHIELLKSILTEYFKVSHETNEISKAMILDKKISCNALTKDPQIIMGDLLRFKVISEKNDGKISFATTAFREALISSLAPQSSDATQA